MYVVSLFCYYVWNMASVVKMKQPEEVLLIFEGMRSKQGLQRRQVRKVGSTWETNERR